MGHEAHDGTGRVGRVQALFREVNERVVETTTGDRSPEPFEVLCECGSDGCVETIAISTGEYEAIRRIPTHFLVRHGHVVRDAERIVAREDDYLVVEKFGDAGIAAVRLDPRGRRINAEATDPRS
jgi:hypothetical protein